MTKPTAIVFSGALVLALIAGAASRDLTLHATAAAPVTFVVQTTAPAPAPASAPIAAVPAESFD